MNLETFSKENLRWSKEKKGDGKYFDCNGVSLLIYALMWSNDSLIREAINIAVSVDEIESRMKSSCPSIGLFGSGANSLIVAMMYAKPSSVSLLLQSGANPKHLDDDDVDAFTRSCSFGRLENVRFWLERFPQWSVTKNQSRSEGTSAMYVVVFNNTIYFRFYSNNKHDIQLRSSNERTRE